MTTAQKFDFTDGDSQDELVRLRPAESRSPVTASVAGPFEVTGHTDNVPIRTLRFPSNWHLSKARADAVAVMMAPPLLPSKLRVEGRADTEPLESNDAAEGRTQNRRVEVRLPLS